jgi:hypothetical protein
MLSKQSLEILIDLVEIKISTIMIQDKDDIREVKRLKNCRSELLASHRVFTKTGGGGGECNKGVVVSSPS